MNIKEFYKMLGTDLVDYLSAKGGKISKEWLEGYFIYRPQAIATPMQNENLKFVDGYAQIMTNKFEIQHEHDWSQDCYCYNYVKENGDTVFDNDFTNVVIYIGRNIFLQMDEDNNWYISSPDKEKQRIEYTGKAIPESGVEQFVRSIIVELNAKYFMEINRKGNYLLPKRGKGKQMMEDICGMEFNSQEMVLQFAGVISSYDEMSRDMYSLLSPIAMSILTNFHDIDNNAKTYAKNGRI